MLKAGGWGVGPGLPEKTYIIFNQLKIRLSLQI